MVIWNRDVDQSKYVLLKVNGNVVNRWRPIKICGGCYIIAESVFVDMFYSRIELI